MERTVSPRPFWQDLWPGSLRPAWPNEGTARIHFVKAGITEVIR